MRIREMFTCIGIRKTLETLMTFFVQVRNFYYLLDLGLWTWGERHTISTMLTVSSDPTARVAPPKTQLESSRFGSQLTRPVSNLNWLLFFKNNPKSPAHRFRVWRYSHPQSHFLSGGFIMTSVIVTSSPCEREYLRSMCVPTRALSWTVLSLTKPKNKI